MDDVHVRNLQGDELDALCQWLEELNMEGLALVHFMSSEESAFDQLSGCKFCSLAVSNEVMLTVWFSACLVSGMSKRLKAVYVPYADSSDVKAYLEKATNMNAIQVNQTLHVTGASMHDVGEAVAVSIGLSSTDLQQPLSGYAVSVCVLRCAKQHHLFSLFPLALLLNQTNVDKAEMESVVLDGVVKVPVRAVHTTAELPRADIITASLLLFETLRAHSGKRVLLRDISPLNVCPQSTFDATLDDLVSTNLLFIFVDQGDRFLIFHDPRQLRTFELIVPKASPPRSDPFAEYPDDTNMEVSFAIFPFCFF